MAVLAGRLAEELGLAGPDRRDCYDAALLRWLGCTATAQPLSAWMGDEIAAHRRAARFATPLDPLLEILRGYPAGSRCWPAPCGPGVVFGSACEASTHLAARLGYSPGVVARSG